MGQLPVFTASASARQNLRSERMVVGRDREELLERGRTRTLLVLDLGEQQPLEDIRVRVIRIDGDRPVETRHGRVEELLARRRVRLRAGEQRRQPTRVREGFGLRRIELRRDEYSWSAAGYSVDRYSDRA